jgi:hypothetical protein
MFCAPELVFGGRGPPPFLCFALPDSFLAVSRASGPVLMFCAPELIFGGPDDVRSRFHVLRPRTRFRRYRGRQVMFSCFALPDSYSAVPRVSGPVFIFCPPGLIFGGTEGVGSRFRVLCGRTPFSAVPRALGPVFMFCTSGQIFGGSEGVGSCFHVLRPRTNIRWFRGRRVPI